MYEQVAVLALHLLLGSQRCTGTQGWHCKNDLRLVLTSGKMKLGCLPYLSPFSLNVMFDWQAVFSLPHPLISVLGSHAEYHRWWEWSKNKENLKNFSILVVCRNVSQSLKNGKTEGGNGTLQKKNFNFCTEKINWNWFVHIVNSDRKKSADSH